MLRNFSRIILVLCVMLSAIIHPTLAEGKKLPQQDVQFTQWMTYYYLYKDEIKVREFLEWLQTSQTLEKNEGTLQPIVAFLSLIFADNKSQLQSWLKADYFTGRTKEAIKYSLWLSGNGELVTTIFKETPDYTKSPPIKLLNMELKSSGDLDMMWGAFLASGNDQYVKKIIDVLDDTTPLTGEKILDMITRASAEWSLGSNMVQHELVNRLIRKEIITRSGAVKKKLKSIVSRKERASNGFPNSDGDFSAMMIMTDESGLKEYEKPSSEGLSFQEVHKAKRGDILIVNIVFSGMELTNELMSDVTFDLKVLSPEGKIYDNSELKNVEALKRKTPMRFSIFHNRPFLRVHFGPNDKLGKYQFIVTIHDNVAKKSIPLKKEVELIQ